MNLAASPVWHVRDEKPHWTSCCRPKHPPRTCWSILHASSLKILSTSLGQSFTKASMIRPSHDSNAIAAAASGLPPRGAANVSGSGFTAGARCVACGPHAGVSAAPLCGLLQASRGQPPRAAPMRSVLPRCVGVRTSKTSAQGPMVLRWALVPAPARLMQVWCMQNAARRRQPVPDASHA